MSWVSESRKRAAEYLSGCRESGCEGDVDVECVVSTIASLDQVLAATTPATQLLRFTTVEEEVNALVVLHLLKRPTPYEGLLREQTGKGVHDTVMFGLVRAHVSGKSFTPKAIGSMTVTDVGEMFEIPLSVEVALMPGVYEEKPGPLKAVAEEFLKALKNTATELAESGHASFWDWFEKGGWASGPESAGSEKGGEAKAEDGVDTKVGAKVVAGPSRPSAVQVVSSLSKTFTYFRDIVSTEDAGGDFMLAANASALVSDLQTRFGGTHPGVFGYSDMGDLLPCVNGRLIVGLRNLGALKLSKPATDSLRDGKTTSALVQQLRCTCVAVVDTVAKRVGATPIATSLFLLRKHGSDLDDVATETTGEKK